jgi:hypothetical protein
MPRTGNLVAQDFSASDLLVSSRQDLTVDGAFFALDNACTHEEGPQADGWTKREDVAETVVFLASPTASGKIWCLLQCYSAEN